MAAPFGFEGFQHPQDVQTLQISTWGQIYFQVVEFGVFPVLSEIKQK